MGSEAPEDDGDEGSTRFVGSKRFWGWAQAFVAAVVFAAVILTIHKVLAEYPLHAIIAELRGIPLKSVTAAGLLTALSYSLLTLHDKFGLRYAGVQLPYPRAAMTSFAAYAFGHNFGFSALTGGAVRYRMYSALGVNATEVATVAVFCGLATIMGLAVVGGAALFVAPPASSAMHLGHTWTRVVGVLLILFALAYLAWASFARGRIQIGSWSLRPPGALLALVQIGVAVTDLLVAGGVVWVLLPESAHVEFAAFIATFAIAIVAGMVSQVPGGLGVFEGVLLVSLPQVPAPQLLGALLAYRAIYYLAPLVTAALLLGAHELVLVRGHIAKAGALARVAPVLRPVAPQFIGALVFLAGTVLLISGATPGIDVRLREVRHILPLPLLELSHLAGSVAGVGLLILARGLYRRLNAAYHMTFWLLVAGIVASLFKGFDVEEATFLAVTLLVLRLASGEFYRPAGLFAQRLSPAWFVSVAIILALSVWIGFLTYRHVPYSNDLWWTFALHGDASRMLRASFAASVILAAFLLAYWLHPAREPARSASSDDLEKAQAALQHSSSSVGNVVLTGDKRILFHPAGDAFVMYQVSGRSWIALGDPVGPIGRHAELVWSFRELVDRCGGQVVFYQVSGQSLPLYVDLGLSLTKLGEEARVDLAAFTLQGSRAADLRQSHRRAQRSGLSFEIVPAEGVSALLPRLRAVSDAWLGEKATREKGFSVGAFDEAYLTRLPVAVVRCEGHVVAFANLWPTATKDELSVDLMRFGPDAPPSTMDYLFIELMLWGQAQGYRWFNLGMAPLSGLENRALAPLWHRVGSFLYRNGESFYNFEGLRRFKEKFHPRWEPRYLASAGGMRLPRALLDVSTLISGGLRELVVK